MLAVMAERSLAPTRFCPQRKRGCTEALKAVWCVGGTGRISLAHGALGSDDRTVECAPQVARSQGSRHSVVVLIANEPLSLFLLDCNNWGIGLVLLNATVIAVRCFAAWFSG